MVNNSNFLGSNVNNKGMSSQEILQRLALDSNEGLWEDIEMWPYLQRSKLCRQLFSVYGKSPLFSLPYSMGAKAGLRRGKIERALTLACEKNPMNTKKRNTWIIKLIKFWVKSQMTSLRFSCYLVPLSSPLWWRRKEQSSAARIQV